MNIIIIQLIFFDFIIINESRDKSINAHPLQMHPFVQSRVGTLVLNAHPPYSTRAMIFQSDHIEQFSTNAHT